MANPGLQLTTSQYSGDGSFGECDFGGDAVATPYGGHNYAPESLPLVQLGSDDIAESNREFVSEVTLSRFGHTVASRAYSTANRWTVNYNGITATERDTLKSYFEARIFYLLPDSSDDTVSTKVKWSGTEFRPVFQGGGLWSITFDLEELLA